MLYSPDFRPVPLGLKGERCICVNAYGSPPLTLLDTWTASAEFNSNEAKSFAHKA